MTKEDKPATCSTCKYWVRAKEVDYGNCSTLLEHHMGIKDAPYMIDVKQDYDDANAIEVYKSFGCVLHEDKDDLQD